MTLEVGRLAKQADGSAFVRYGDTVVLATACANQDPREGVSFFPLTVDYREYTYAAGKIPGGFFKREGRPSEKEILTSRMIDRPVRPLFADGFRCETQVIAMVLSADSDNDPDVVGMVGASAALYLSNIPFHNPIGAVRVGLVEGQLVINPTYSEQRAGLLNIVVVGTEEAIVMVEAVAQESPSRWSARPFNSGTKPSRRSWPRSRSCTSRWASRSASRCHRSWIRR